ncbi:MAG TPA: ParB/RepB/Spo0J family partition protein [Geobacteraceae bacterium]|nr:ParB/RepB/Spo0J family partition protein [Geobacteraceae bacterium]
MNVRDDAANDRGSQMQLFEVESASRTANARKKSTKPTRYQPGKMYLIDIDMITPNPDQPRQYFNEADLLILADSIKDKGLLQPVLCRSEEGILFLCAGERKLRAVRLAGLTRIPVRIVTGDPLETALVENLMRSDLTAVEEAEAIAALKERNKYRLEDLTGITGKAAATLSEILSLTRLPEEILDVCRCDASVPRDILVMIARLPGSEAQVAAFDQYRQGIIHRQDLAEKARKLKNGQIRKPTPITYVRSFTKRFTRFNIGAINEKERESLRNELERLMASIAQTLENLK